MTETNNQEAPKKKMTLQEAVKQKLEEKKNQSAGGKTSLNGSTGNQKMKSQQTKKVSNTRRKMGV
ncbi:hypothetical protein SAMN04487786_1949 [Paenisporosarcina quisquiliarum]|uniref:Uncharacterized protein n=1 Tax=Psychrobacillus psychrodurans TaxID=126157 RepID=A0A9X3RC61_9BACI|nr:hypothetical protein [Psychrobacillus psychrodurans]MCK1996518.1 hypothetical protein [Psychrobacillus psychrodurans]MCZ8534962.1 hypothetical protein [Psychrobacillus psychrodurans]SEM49754.1 hypothetical protein SAMN04487786_1949 [Paenisporosarcina quisquiliarum]